MVGVVLFTRVALWFPACAGMTDRARHTGFKAVSTGQGTRHAESSPASKEERRMKTMSPAKFLCIAFFNPNLILMKLHV